MIYTVVTFRAHFHQNGQCYIWPLTHPFTYTHKCMAAEVPSESNLRCSVLLKNTLACEQEQLIRPQPLWLMDNQLYFLTHSYPAIYQSPSRGLSDRILL